MSGAGDVRNAMVDQNATDPRETPEFRAYLRARDAVVRIKAAGAAANASLYWTEELENIDYLIEASPLIVRKLRHHAFHITGSRPYDYREKHDGRRTSFEARLQALRALGGDGLFVPEAPALGGFGFTVDGRLCNVDTLKFYEVLIAMERGGVLPAVRAIDRPVVCEIGAGWGGFAYQFKTLFPRTTYVIVDFPELFLFSATYLGTVFPDARVVFVGTDGDMTAVNVDGVVVNSDEGVASTDEVVAGTAWRDADFVFVPHTLSRLVSTLPVDLTVNMVSFQEMTDAQVRGYAAMAAAAGCPLLYSLNRERSLYNTELVSVSDALADCYRLTEVPVLDTDYTHALKKPAKRVRMVAQDEARYRHLIGRLDPSTHPSASARASTRVSAGDVGPRAKVSPAGPRVVLGMTLYNAARHLPSAMESLLAQTYGDFVLLLLDDASPDETEQVAREYVERDDRVRYVRHQSRQAMIATWHEVAERALTDWPTATYFAWVSDHDWWHPRWLERLVAELDAEPQAVLAYPITKRMSTTGVELEKGPRLFDTVGCRDLRARWRHFCHEGVGSGDMVYGVMRADALRRTGIFRQVLRPDRLTIVEMTLQGGIRQVPEMLWFRRESQGTSVERQSTSLMLPGTEPRWFFWPPWLQHSLVLWREYAARAPQPLPIARVEWAGMLLRYQLLYGWRHFRKTTASHAIGRAMNTVVWLKKQAKHHYHHGIYNALVGARVARGKLRRAARRGIYEVAMLLHRLGLKGRRETPSS